MKTNSLLLCLFFISLCHCHTKTFLQISRSLSSPLCNNHGYHRKGKCFCQSQWTGEKCQTSKSSGWHDTDSKCDDLYARLDNLANISPEYYHYDDDELPRLSGNSVGGVKFYENKTVTWIKMHDIDPNFRIFSNDSLNNLDIHQKGLANCYVLAAFASLANIRGGELIKDVFETKTDNDKHVYVTRWFINGKPRYVAVDEWVPGEPGGNIPTFSQPTGDHDFWAIILEKAWAKIYGSYKNTEYGYIVSIWHALTKSPVFEIQHIRSVTPNFIFDKLKMMLNNEYPVATATVNIDFTNEVKDHAYSVLGVYEVRLDNNKIQKLIRIYNPWKKEVWSDNPWADTKSVWTEKVKNQVPYTNSDDGQFYVTPEDYLANFGITYWAEVRRGYDVTFQDLGIPSNHVKYVFKFKVTNNLRRDLYIFIDTPDSRILQDCGQPFVINNLVVSGSSKRYHPDNYGTTVKVEAAVDGEYTITLNFERKQSFLQYFTVSIYAASGTIQFLANQYPVIVNHLTKACPNNCNNQGRCNTFNGVCKCYFGFTGSDCSQKIVKQCPNKCNRQEVCDTTFGICRNKCENKKCSGNRVCNVETGLCVCSENHSGEKCEKNTPKVDCVDKISYCAVYVPFNYCQKHFKSMQYFCSRSCEFCK